MTEFVYENNEYKKLDKSLKRVTKKLTNISGPMTLTINESWHKDPRYNSLKSDSNSLYKQLSKRVKP